MISLALDNWLVLLWGDASTHSLFDNRDLQELPAVDCPWLHEETAINPIFRENVMSVQEDFLKGLPVPVVEMSSSEFDPHPDQQIHGQRSHPFAIVAEAVC